MKTVTGITGSIETGLTLDIGDKRLVLLEVHCTLAHADRAGGEDGVYRYQKTAVNEGVILDPDGDVDLINLAVAKLNTAAGRMPITGMDDRIGKPDKGKRVTTDANGVLLLDGEAAELRGDEPSARICRECGCTDRVACPGGCSWVELDLCSSCEPGGGQCTCFPGDSSPEGVEPPATDIDCPIHGIDARDALAAEGDIDGEAPAPDSLPEGHAIFVFADGQFVEATISRARANYVASEHPDAWVHLVYAPEETNDDEALALCARQWTREHAPWFGLRPAADAIAGIDAIDPVVPVWALRLLVFLERRSATPRPEVLDELEKWIREDAAATAAGEGEAEPPVPSGAPDEPTCDPSPAPNPGEEGDPALPQPSSPALTSEGGEALVRSAPQGGPPVAGDTPTSPPSDDPSVHAATLEALWPRGIARYRLDQLQKPLRQRLADGEQDPAGLIAAVRAADIAAHPLRTGRKNVLRWLDSIEVA